MDLAVATAGVSASGHPSTKPASGSSTAGRVGPPQEGAGLTMPGALSWASEAGRCHYHILA